MPQVPAICDSCGLVWEPNALRIEGDSTEIYVGAGSVSPCPRCGGRGHLVSGTYDTTAATETAPETMTALVQSPVDALALQRYARELAALREAPATTAEDVREVFADAPSDVRRAVDWALKNKGTVLAAIGVILAFLAFLEQRHGNSIMQKQLDLQRAQIEQPVRPGQANEPLTTAPRDTVVTVPSSKKPGRNSPCPCGSGQKFKRCCEPTWPTLKPTATPPEGEQP